MPDPNIVRVNNTLYSFASTRMQINGDPWEGFVSIEYPQKRERKLVYAGDPAGRPKGWTAGKYTAGAIKMGFLKDSAAALEAMVAAKAGSYSETSE